MAEVIRTEIREGHEIRIYDNGMVRDFTDNRIIHPPTSALITPENARQMHARRSELAVQRARDAVDDAAIAAGKIPTNAAGGGLGWYSIVYHATATLLGSNATRGQSELGTFIGKATRYLVPDEATPENIAAAIAHLFLPFLERVPKPPETIEGEVIQ